MWQSVDDGKLDRIKGLELTEFSPNDELSMTPLLNTRYHRAKRTPVSISRLPKGLAEPVAAYASPILLHLSLGNLHSGTIMAAASMQEMGVPNTARPLKTAHSFGSWKLGGSK